MKTWLSVFRGIDGVDIDYEAENVAEDIPETLAQIRSKLDALSKEEGKRPCYVTVSPANITYLAQAAASLSYVNLQTYAGGWDLRPQDFLNIGFQSQQLLYGICPESMARSRNVEQVEKEYKNNDLAGIHL